MGLDVNQVILKNLTKLELNPLEVEATVSEEL